MDLTQLDSWGSLFRAGLASAVVIFAALGLGRFVSKRSSSVAFEVIVGTNILGLVSLAVGRVYWPSMLIVLLLLSAWGVVALVRGFVQDTAARNWMQLKQPWPWQLRIVIAGVLFSLGPALTYPSGWDELTYHVELPRRWTEAKAFLVFADLPYAALPSLCEILFTLTYPIEPFVTPRLLTWVVWICSLLEFRLIANQLAGAKNGNAVTWTVALSPVILMTSANCYVEAFIAANTICLLRIVLDPLGQSLSYRRRVLLCAICIGGSLAIKVTSVGLVLIPLLFALLRRHPQMQVSRAIAAAVLGMLFAAPFYARTWLATGNPFSPYFATWFTNDANVIESSLYHHELASGNFGISGVLGFVADTIALAFANEVFDGAFGLQWLLLLALACIGLGYRQNALRAIPLTRFLLLSSLLLYLLWFSTSQQARFAIAVLVLIALAAAAVLGSLTEVGQRWSRVALIAMALVSFPWTHLAYYADSWLCVLKIRQPVDYLRDGVSDSYVELAYFLKEQLPSNAKIISLFEHRLAYLPSGVEIGTPFFQTKHFPNPRSETPLSLLDELRNRGIQYVILTTNPLGPDIAPHWIEAQQAWYASVDECISNGSLRIVFKSDNHAVAQVVSP